MPSLINHQSATSTKMLLIGESGAGKTGALASLVKAGYNLRVLDFDNGLDILASLLKADQAALSRVAFETCTDKFKSVSGQVVSDGAPKAWAKAMTTLDKWPELGAVTTWGEKDILVIDSLTFAANAAMRHVLFLNGKTTETRRIQDWGAAMDLIENLLAMLYSDSVKCNVIINSHITYVELENGLSKGYPSAIGSKLLPKIARYFNNVLMVKTAGAGANIKRTIRTVTDGSIDLKTSLSPGTIPTELPLETGLATFFAAVKGAKPAA